MAEFKAEVPFELLMEVLSWLPVKSLMRFKSVSKHWYSFINHPIFTHTYHTRASFRGRRVLLLLRNQWNSLEWGAFNIAIRSGSSIPHMPRSVPCTGCYRMTNVANGLVCLYRERQSRNSYWIDFRLHNLTTRETIPLPPTLKREFDRSRKCFEFLEFDPVNNQYRVIHCWTISHRQIAYDVLPLGDEDNIWMPKIITSNTNVFGNGNSKVSISSQFKIKGSVCFGGVIYGMTRGCYFGLLIMALDFKNDRFEMINYPQRKMPNVLNLAHLGGRLALLGHSSKSKHFLQFQLWRLMDKKDEGGSLWSEEVITWPRLLTPSALAVCCQSEEVISMCRIESERLISIDSYDRASGEYMEVQVKNGGNLSKRVIMLSEFVENITSLKNLKGKHILSM